MTTGKCIFPARSAAAELPTILALVENFGDDKTIEITVAEHKPRRTLAQKGLYWVWMGDLAKHLSRLHGGVWTKEDLHDYCRKRFLPIRPARKVGSLIIPEHLTSTESLKVDAMTKYMMRIEVWSAESLMHPLPIPEDSDYWLSKERQEK